MPITSFHFFCPLDAAAPHPRRRILLANGLQAALENLRERDTNCMADAQGLLQTADGDGADLHPAHADVRCSISALSVNQALIS